MPVIFSTFLENISKPESGCSWTHLIRSIKFRISLLRLSPHPSTTLPLTPQRSSRESVFLETNRTEPWVLNRTRFQNVSTRFNDFSIAINIDGAEVLSIAHHTKWTIEGKKGWQTIFLHLEFWLATQSILTDTRQPPSIKELQPNYWSLNRTLTVLYNSVVY